MKVYISLPITGQDPDEVEAEAADIYGLPMYKGLDKVPENNALWFQMTNQDTP